MSVRVIRLGPPRSPNEGPRIGTVRRPPRGVPKAQFSSGNWYDVWFPNLAPSAPTMKLGLAAASPKEWTACAKKFRAEMAKPDAAHALRLLAVLARSANFSVGCDREDENHGHRSVLRQLLIEHGAIVA